MVGQGWAYGVLRTERRVKVGMVNRSNGYEVRVLEMNTGQGGIGIGVQDYMECNTPPYICFFPVCTDQVEPSCDFLF